MTCRAPNILMVPGTHAKRKTVYLVKTTWRLGTSLMVQWLRLCNETSFTVLVPVQRSHVYSLLQARTPLWSSWLLLTESLTTAVILLHFECHGHQDYGNPWRMSVLIFYSLSWWCEVSLLGSLGRLGPWHNPRFMLDNPRVYGSWRSLPKLPSFHS